MRKFNTRRFKKDERGVLGLPLNLLVMVIVAVIAIAILVLWLNPFTETKLGTVETYDSAGNPASAITLDASDHAVFSVKVYGSDGDPLEGAGVVVTGCNVTKSLNTDENGKASFDVLVELPVNQDVGTLSISVTYKEMTKEQPLQVSK